MRQDFPDTPTAPNVGTSRRARDRWLRTAGIGATLAVCLVLALFAVLLMRGPAGPHSLYVTPPSAPTSWQTYRDPAGLFTVRLPASWNAHVDTGTATFGDRTGSATETQETIRFSDQTQGGASAAVYVTVDPIRTDFEQHWYCQAWQSSKRDSFHEYPAVTMPATWLFESATAHFQLSYMIPGVAGPLHTSPLILTPAPTPTPLPQTWIDDDKTIVNTILSAFQPTNASPLSC